MLNLCWELANSAEDGIVRRRRADDFSSTLRTTVETEEVDLFHIVSCRYIQGMGR